MTERIANLLETAVGNINSFMYSYLLIILLIAAGIYFTIRTKFIQIRMIGESIRVLGDKTKKDDSVSSFQALMVSTASRVGTGNIVGVSTAICLGGYGAVFWMWIIAVIGAASAFMESTLAQIFKKKTPKGEFYGGPAYYIEAITHTRIPSIIFAVSMLLTYGAGFNMLCSYNLQSTFAAYGFYDANITPYIIGGIVAVLLLYCLMGGGKRIIKTTSTLVPIMGVIYVLFAIVVLILNIKIFPSVMRKIIVDAFDFTAIFGGFTGSCMMYGIKRGLYSNEAGVGSAPNASASAEVTHPVKQGLVQMLSVFIDTLLLCSATALMCLCSGVEPIKELAGAPYVQEALKSTLGIAGPVFITISMIMFAFTTLLGNIYYTDNLLIYILKRMPGKVFIGVFRVICALLVFLGAISSMSLLWDISDVLMGVMVIINIPVLLIGCKYVFVTLKDYEKQKKQGKDPSFKASDVGLIDNVDCWD